MYAVLNSGGKQYKVQPGEILKVENKLLAQTLFKISEIGDYIPAELYQAVAEVLAYVYRLKGMQTSV